MNLDQKIRKIPDWPKSGVLFYDVTTLFEDKETFRYMINELCWPYEGRKIDKIVGIDARGFLLASTMAYKLNAGLSIVRKKGKLPYRTINKDYSLEYGCGTVEMHDDTIKPGEKVVIVDDLIATGGTMKAAAEMVEELGGEIVGISWIVDLPFLGGSEKIKNYNCHCLIKYDSEKVNAEEEIFLSDSLLAGSKAVAVAESSLEKLSLNFRSGTKLFAMPEEKNSADKLCGRAKLPIKIGIIGGSGLEKMEILKNAQYEKISTPYGAPSDLAVSGTIDFGFKQIEAVIIPRHGKNHTIAPSKVNYRANIWAMKESGVTHILAPTACGSLKEEIKPGDFVAPDQLIDRTNGREQTFFEGRVCHIPMAEPFCPRLRKLVEQSACRLGITLHSKGTMITIEGPRFSTKAESDLFRMWNADIINMTTMPEAVLAREAGICYQTIAMVTDYDCWRETEEAVNIGMILETMKKNSLKMEKLLVETVLNIDYAECECREAYKTAII